LFRLPLIFPIFAYLSIEYLESFNSVSAAVTQRIHCIAIGGSIMHNLALELAAHGHRVTGSDDVIHNPARDRLASAQLLPDQEGWFPEKITADIDVVILGMHARADNPELLRAQELQLKVYSFPEFIYQYSRNKQRIVIAGSHGKTTITAMVIHVLRQLGISFDYLVGAQLEGMERMVSLSTDKPMIVMEGDEYLASALDQRPKFQVLDPHILVLSGISWDHINVFPTEADYIRQFSEALAALTKAGMCIYNKEDKIVRDLANRFLKREYHFSYPFLTPPYRLNKQQQVEIKIEGKRFPISVIGKHNAANVAAAWQVCRLLAVNIDEFIVSIGSFKGADLRLQTVYEDANTLVIRDFAHAPSKVLASVEAVAEHYKDRNVVACLELHTFSSLNRDYLKQYRNTLKKIKHKVVLISKKTLEHKRALPIAESEIRSSFHDNAIQLAQSCSEVVSKTKAMLKGRNVILLMSSGNLDGLDWHELLP
jgi:UDP-N-acetylmuramate: L-alanyl-gamma-D-glutamyl-meso-diaminopimelate ligase